MAKKAVVTGAAGFVGSHLCDRLLDDGWAVTGIDCFTDYYARELKEAAIASAREHDAFAFTEADLVEMASGGSLARVVDDADAVFHLAAQAGVRASWGRDFEIYTRNNVEATQLLLETLKDTGTRVVYASSSSVYGDTDVLPMREDAACWPHSPYGVTKLAAEHLCRLYSRNFGLPTVALRFFTVYGPRQRPDMAFNKFAKAMLTGQDLEVYGDGSQTRDFTFVSDIVEGLVLALDAPSGETFNLGGGSRVTLTAALETLAGLTGAQLRIKTAGVQPGDVKDTSASLEKSGRTLGYSPKVGLREGLAAEVDWLRGLLAS